MTTMRGPAGLNDENPLTIGLSVIGYRLILIRHRLRADLRQNNKGPM
uniref:Uncharacterized protein n=1 Tax=Arundo donax TaxID=35708 RepID=A0A0A9C060_ARUDO